MSRQCLVMEKVPMSQPDILGRDRIWVSTWRLCRNMTHPGRDRVGTIGPRRAKTAL